LYTEYVVEAVLTRRGRRAKRISYAHMHGYGKNHEDFYEKPRNVSEEKKEKKEIQCCGKHVKLPVMRPTVPSKKIVEFEIEQDVNPDNIISNVETLSEMADDANEVSMPDETASAVCSSTEFLENENSEIVDDPSAVPEEAQTEKLRCSEQQNNVIIHNENGCEEEIKMEKGEDRIFFSTQKGLDKDIIVQSMFVC
jgi:hypothetical protein